LGCASENGYWRYLTAWSFCVQVGGNHRAGERKNDECNHCKGCMVNVTNAKQMPDAERGSNRLQLQATNANCQILLPADEFIDKTTQEG
jgi:hypothetical protein